MTKWLFVAAAWLVLSAAGPFTLPNFQLTVTSTGAGASVSINGSTTPGQALTAGSTMTVAAAGGPGNQNDAVYVCDHADGCAPAAGMDYTYLNCSKSTPASPPYPTATPPGGCTMAVPGTNGSYYVNFYATSTNTNLAQLDFLVGSGVPAISGVSVSPNTVMQGAAYSGTLSTTCSTSCPNASVYSLVVDATRCPSANNTPFSLSGATLSMTAQSSTGTQTACVRVAVNGTSNTPADFPVAVSVTASGPTITVNGSSTGATVAPSANLTVTVANGPAANDDWMGICNAGVAPSSNQCDGAGYKWGWVTDCTSTGVVPTSGKTGNTCTLSAPAVSGNYVATFFHTNAYTNPLVSAPFTVTGGTASITAVAVSPNTFSVSSGGTASFSGTLSAICSVSPCPGPATFTLASAPAPAITVNGSSSGATVSAGASMTVAATNGPGNNNDWMSICTTATPSNASCDGAGYQWDFMSCTHTPPQFPSASASCPLSAPSSAGNYQAVFFWCNYPSNCPNGGYNVLASAPFTVTGGGGGTASCTSSVGGPSPTPCPVGRAAPAGSHWNLTFYDDFRQDSSINGSLWTQNNTAGSVITCCDPTYGIRSYPHLDLGNLGNTWTDIAMNPAYQQRYGFFELGFRWPTDASGEGDGRHVDINVNVSGGCGSACSELDISEQELGTGAQYLDNSFMHDCDASQSSRPQCGGQTGTAQWVAWSTPDGLKMSDHNRALGMQWTNDGTAHGTVQVFLDGSAVTGTHSLVSSAFDLGARWDIFDVACEGTNWGNGSAACNSSTSSPGTNPLSIQYVAMWQLAPN